MAVEQKANLAKKFLETTVTTVFLKRRAKFVKKCKTDEFLDLLVKPLFI